MRDERTYDQRDRNDHKRHERAPQAVKRRIGDRYQRMLPSQTQSREQRQKADKTGYGTDKDGSNHYLRFTQTFR